MLRQINGCGPRDNEATRTNKYGAKDGAAQSTVPNWAGRGSSPCRVNQSAADGCHRGDNVMDGSRVRSLAMSGTPTGIRRGDAHCDVTPAHDRVRPQAAADSTGYWAARGGRQLQAVSSRSSPLRECELSTHSRHLRHAKAAIQEIYNRQSLRLARGRWAIVNP
jgi:hypothetical protein